MNPFKGGQILNPYDFNKLHITIDVDMQTMQAEIKTDRHAPLILLSQIFLNLIAGFVMQLAQVGSMIVKPETENPDINEEKGGQDNGKKENSDN